jgi:putative selenate reductase
MSLVDFQKKVARRQWAMHPRELPAEERLNFRVVSESFTPEEARREADRCLLCDEICNVCVGVCPNRANFSYTVKPVQFALQKIQLKNGQVSLFSDGDFRVEQTYQVLNIADWCNECGNCTTFCPTSGAPYRDKPKFCLSEESFRNETAAYRFEKKEETLLLRYKNGGKEETLFFSGEKYVYQTEQVEVELRARDFSVVSVRAKTKENRQIHLRQAAALRVLLDNLRQTPLAKISPE